MCLQFHQPTIQSPLSELVKTVAIRKWTLADIGRGYDDKEVQG